MLGRSLAFDTLDNVKLKEALKTNWWKSFKKPLAFFLGSLTEEKCLKHVLNSPKRHYRHGF